MIYNHDGGLLEPDRTEFPPKRLIDINIAKKGQNYTSRA